ncbi:SDR family oxidoreductase [Thalassoroseus pseudoceratinae]|uniref:SDR family oxidoreductase n=1 Tax=Thalassoroseus pseudoceratinae TaxID=2713176 RepID=UPI00142389F9|nr:SDR family oxidoreductase [Thalassoroseus pseudoceratinae]
MIDLTGKTALVTGGSRGVGRAVALRLAEAGADVVINYLTSQSRANAVAEEVQQLGRQALTVKADVSEAEDAQAMMEFVGERFERLDILVSNAAGGGFRPLMQASPRHFDAAMHTNARALMTLVQAAHPLLTAQTSSQAKVIALSSHGSQRALTDYGLIGASKAALESLTRHLALELGRDGINFNVVLAGLLPTDAIQLLPGAEDMFTALKETLLVPNRELKTEDVADAVLYLASPLSDLVQGHTLVIDGGISIRS